MVLVVGLALGLLLWTDPRPTATIRVFDEKGKPVAGAVVTPDGMRPVGGGGHYFWRENPYGKPESVATGVDGLCRVHYPRFLETGLPVGEISFSVKHPDFCPDRPFQTVKWALPATAPAWQRLLFELANLVPPLIEKFKPPPIVLKRGAIVMVAGHLEKTETNVSNLRVQVSNWLLSGETWRPAGDGRLVSKQISAGTNYLRLVWLPEGEPTCFSDVVEFVAKAGRTNEFRLPLNPGVRVAGSLDASVPRPVRMGRVVANMRSGGNEADNLDLWWKSWRPVQPDGTFEFDSFPPGQMEAVAICDGFVSVSGATNPPTFQRPQLFPIHRPSATPVIRMEQTASCEITVLDEKDRPLTNAQVAFWPNVRWGDWAAELFGENCYRQEELLRTGDSPDWYKIFVRCGIEDFAARTGTNGVAVVRNLPAFRQPFSVTCRGYRMPQNPLMASQTSSAVDLETGKTAKVIVRMRRGD